MGPTKMHERAVLTTTILQRALAALKKFTSRLFFCARRGNNYPGFHIYTGVGGVHHGFTIFPTPLPHFDWDFPTPLPRRARRPLPPRHRGGAEKKRGWVTRAKNPTPLPQKFLVLGEKNLPPYPPKTVTKLMYPPPPMELSRAPHRYGGGWGASSDPSHSLPPHLQKNPTPL